MKCGFDIGAYLARIGYDGARSATLASLKAIHALHPASIPFENLNPLLRIPVALDIQSLQSKLVEGRRGGYCFEHNTLLKHALESLGFEVTGLAARVVWNRPDHEITSRGHMALLVTVDGERYIADVGFGGQTLTAPLRFELDLVQPTPHEAFRLIDFAGDFVLQANVRGNWKSMYRFDLQPQFLPDYEITNWYLSNHPQSHFVTGLRVARAVPGRRYNLLGNELTVHEIEGESTTRKLSSESQLREALEQRFGIRLPEHPDLAQTLERIAHQA
jgi:N-hydroxyarylamine O-acetyltransferase